MAGRGRGGQAVIRDEPNAVGIPTKWLPTRNEDAYLDDDRDFDFITAGLSIVFATLQVRLLAGSDVVIPEDGVGTGLAELPTRAPRILRFIEDRVAGLERLAEERRE